MVEGKIKVLEEKKVHLWFEGSPISICSTILALDIDKAEMFASAKFMNIQPDNVKNITFDIICYDALRQPIDCLSDVTFTGFDVPRNGEFGYNRRVTIPHAQTRSVEFVLKSLSNFTGDLWVNDNGLRFDTSLEQQSIFAVQGNLNKQFLEICVRSGIDGSRFSFQPVFKESHWLCGCGCFNWAKEEECFNCGVGKSWLERNSRLEILQKQSNFETDQRNKFHEAQSSFQQNAQDKKIEQEELKNRQKQYKKQLKNEKRKKHFKLLLWVILGLLLAAIAVYGVMTYIIPYFKYTGAVNDFENRRYDNAITKFTELDDFMESREFRLKCIYGKALMLYDSGNSEQAAELFKSIEPYSDSHDQYLLSELESAEKKFSQKEYLEAAEIFTSLGDYQNAPERKQDCIKMIYREAQKNLTVKTVKSLETAYEQFSYTSDYQNSAELLNECIYLLGNVYYSKQQYKDAIEKYRMISDFEYAAQKLKELSMLADLISAASENSPASWSCDGLYCKNCTDTTASYCLELGQDGSYSFWAKCPNHTEEIFSEKGIFKIEQNIIYRMNREDDSVKWEKMFQITSVRPDESIEGKNTILSLDIVKPYDENVASLELYGNILSDDNIVIQ